MTLPDDTPTGSGVPTSLSIMERLQQPAFMVGGFGLAWLCLFGPVYVDFFQTVWARDENAHGPFILAICAGLVYAQISSGNVAPRQDKLSLWLGFAILCTALLAFVIARIGEIELVLSATQLMVATACVLIFFGISGLKHLWFVLVLMMYLVAWPGWMIDALTFPLKMLVSEWVTHGLFSLGLPVTHDGAVITAGPYELLVADACAGMNSLIALTSIGAVYLYVVRRPSIVSNVITVLLLVPIAIFANIVRVAVLVLITYWLGYDAGQSFLHELSGLVMFAAALVTVFAVEAAAAAVAAAGAARYAMVGDRADLRS